MSIQDIINHSVTHYRDERILQIKRVNENYYSIKLRDVPETQINTTTILQQIDFETQEMITLEYITDLTNQCIQQVIEHSYSIAQNWELIRHKRFEKMVDQDIEISMICMSPSSCAQPEWDSMLEVAIKKKNVYGIFLVSQIIGDKKLSRSIDASELTHYKMTSKELQGIYDQYLLYREFPMGIILDSLIERNDSVSLSGQDISELSMTTFGISALIQTLNEEYNLAFAEDSDVLVLRLNANTVEIIRNTPAHLKEAGRMARNEAEDGYLKAMQPDVEYFFERPVISKVKIIPTAARLLIREEHFVYRAR